MGWEQGLLFQRTKPERSCGCYGLPCCHHTRLESKCPPFYSCFQWVGRGQSLAWALARFRASASRESLTPTQLFPGCSLGLGPLSAYATSSGKPNQRDHSVPSQLCLKHPFLTSSLQDGSREPKPRSLWILLTGSLGISGGLKHWGFIFSLAQDRPGLEGRTEGVWHIRPLIGPLGLHTMDRGCRMCSYLFCVLYKCIFCIQ